MVALSPRGREQGSAHASIAIRRWSAVSVALVAIVTLSGCSSLTGAATTTTVAPTSGIAARTAADPATGTGLSGAEPSGVSLAAFYQPPFPLPPGPAGSIIRSMVIPSDGQLPPGAVAYRVLYHSESITGSDIAVSGMVVVPGGTAPKAGFPVVSWAHGTTGLAEQCAPSLDGFTSIPLLDSLLDRRVIVAATDYQGLGVPGVHPYLVGQSEAQGVLDAARAARSLVGTEASNSVVILGYSQGGQAALFASQIASSYAPELYVAGVAAAAPVTSLDEFVPVTPGSTDDQSAVYAVMALAAWSQTYDNLALSSVLTPTALSLASGITSECSGALAATYDSIESGRLFTPGWTLSPALRVDIADNEPGRDPTTTPLLVVEGREDTLTPYATVSAFVSGTLCRSEGDSVDYVPIAGSDHSDVVQSSAAVLLQWISARLAGLPIPDTCTQPGRDRTG